MNTLSINKISLTCMTVCFTIGICIGKYYKEIFDKEFTNCQHILPYYWMPKYSNATDPSARTLEVYNNK